MADIRPFLCIRPREDEAAEIAALPYDVYNREEAKKAVEGHDKSFLRIDRAETQFDDSVDTYAPEVYKKAHDMLWDMVLQPVLRLMIIRIRSLKNMRIPEQIKSRTESTM